MAYITRTTVVLTIHPGNETNLYKYCKQVSFLFDSLSWFPLWTNRCNRLYPSRRTCPPYKMGLNLTCVGLTGDTLGPTIDTSYQMERYFQNSRTVTRSLCGNLYRGKSLSRKFIWFHTQFMFVFKICNRKFGRTQDTVTLQKSFENLKTYTFCVLTYTRDYIKFINPYLKDSEDQ